MDYLKYINYDINKNYSEKEILALDLVFHNLRLYNENNKTNLKVTLDTDEFFFESIDDSLINCMIKTIVAFTKDKITEDNAYGDIIMKLSEIINNTKDKNTLKQMLSNFTFYLGNSERTKKFKGEVSTFL